MNLSKEGVVVRLIWKIFPSIGSFLVGAVSILTYLGIDLDDIRKLSLEKYRDAIEFRQSFNGGNLVFLSISNCNTPDPNIDWLDEKAVVDKLVPLQLGQPGTVGAWSALAGETYQFTGDFTPSVYSTMEAREDERLDKLDEKSFLLLGVNVRECSGVDAAGESFEGKIRYFAVGKLV